MAPVSHPAGDGNVSVVLVLTINEGAQSEHTPWEQDRQGQSVCYNLVKCILFGSFLFVKSEWNSPSEVCLAEKKDTSAVHSFFLFFFLSHCLERSALLLVASGQRQNDWRCSQVLEVCRMFWFQLLFYSALSSSTFPLVFTHCLSLAASLCSHHPLQYSIKFWELPHRKAFGSPASSHLLLLGSFWAGKDSYTALETA